MCKPGPDDPASTLLQHGYVQPTASVTARPNLLPELMKHFTYTSSSIPARSLSQLMWVCCIAPAILLDLISMRTSDTLMSRIHGYYFASRLLILCCSTSSISGCTVFMKCPRSSNLQYAGPAAAGGKVLNILRAWCTEPRSIYNISMLYISGHNAGAQGYQITYRSAAVGGPYTTTNSVYINNPLAMMLCKSQGPSGRRG